MGDFVEKNEYIKNEKTAFVRGQRNKKKENNGQRVYVQKFFQLTHSKKV